MRYRFTFFIGLAVGFVIGARAGRERDEQLKKLASKAKDSPAMQQAAGAAQARRPAWPGRPRTGGADRRRPDPRHADPGGQRAFRVRRDVHHGTGRPGVRRPAVALELAWAASRGNPANGRVGLFRSLKVTV